MCTHDALHVLIHVALPEPQTPGLGQAPSSPPVHLKGRCVELVATFKLSSAANSSSIRLRSPAAARVKMFFAISARLKGVLMVAGSDATVRSKMSPKRESSSGSEALLCSDNISAAPVQIIALSLLPRDLFALGQKEDRSAAHPRRRRSVLGKPRIGRAFGASTRRKAVSFAEARTA